MESSLKKSPKLDYLAESADAKYASGLSTILVATIQEAKDRISQIEYIFCSQLFPKFQLNLQNLQKIYSEATEAAEDAYKGKEKDLLLQIKTLQCEMQQVQEENQLLKLEKTKFRDMESQSCNRLDELMKELEQKTSEVNEGKEVQLNLQKLLDSKVSLVQSYEKTIGELDKTNAMLVKAEKRLEVETEGLLLEMKKKSKELDEAVKFQHKLLQMNQSKASFIEQIENQLKEYEEKTIRLTSKLEDMDKNVNKLQSDLRNKTQEVNKGKELQANLLKKIESQSSEIVNNEQLLNKYEKENKLLFDRVGSLVKCADELRKELEEKKVELGEVRKVQEQLPQQTDSFSCGKIKRGPELEEFEEERKQLLYKQKHLEEKVDKLQQSLHWKMKESSEGMELHGKLLKQIEAKNSEILSEKRKRRDLFAAYKKLKSQYNYLYKQCTQESMLPPDKMEDESEISRHNRTPVVSHDIENNNSKAPNLAIEITKPIDDQEIFMEKKGTEFIQKSGPVSPSSSHVFVAPKCPSGMKSCPPAGAKRPSSYWRDTRAHKSRVGPDPHDDFLDTPLENVRENLGKVMKEDTKHIPKPDPINMFLCNTDDETEDMNEDAGPPMQHVSPPKVGTSGFKYVEPVRKKSERESLKGVECKQCKKFYDAVLPEADKSANGDKQNIRCEHHDGVSRHRYRYAPPSTPEGFWNIGFESEM